MIQNAMFLIIAAFMSAFSFGCRSQSSSGFIISSRLDKVTLLYDKNEHSTVKFAVKALADDIQLITGHRPVISNNLNDTRGNVIIIGTKGKSNLLKELFLPEDQVPKGWESYSFTFQKDINNEVPNALLICGSDTRGTAYGVLDLSKQLGVSPWYWWADVAPEKRDNLSVEALDFISPGPSVKYRGIFLNDEIWGLKPWAAKTFDSETGKIGPKTYEKIFQLLLRLKANTIWPAMHYGTTPFYKVPGNSEMAEKYSIVIGTSHIEQMLRNNIGEWDEEEYGEYNYFNNSENIRKYWEERISQVKDTETIITLGMRGVGDSEMRGGASVEERVRMLEKIIGDQRNMLSRIINKPIDSIPQQIVLYKEVLDLYNAGLNIPEDITLVWCDDNYGYNTRLSNEEEQKRKGGSGIYYHVSYWGRPHDYLWLSSTQPALIWYEMSRAYANGAREIWIVNVGDIKPAEYNMELFLDLAWDINSVSASTINNHLQNWATREFGAALSEEVAFIKSEYYRLAFIRRPEFMGWSRTEPQTRTQDTGFNPNANGNEFKRRIDYYHDLVEKVEQLKLVIPESKKDAWFQLLEYPVRSASLMNKKFLIAQLAKNTTDTSLWSDYAHRAQKAYKEIKKLTEIYNTEVADGKWNNMMSMEPRGLAAYEMPDLTPIEEIDEIDRKNIIREHPLISINANQFSANKGFNRFEWQIIEGLGYSGKAISLFPLINYKFNDEHPWVEYEFDVPEAKEFELQVRFIPTHVNERDAKVTIQIDDQLPQTYNISTTGRSEQWKENVLRNQIIVKQKAAVKEKGTHKVRITVNQTGIIIDQLAIDFEMNESFYEIPVIP